MFPSARVEKLLWLDKKLALPLLLCQLCGAASLSGSKRSPCFLFQFMDELLGSQRAPSVRILPDSRPLRFGFTGGEIFPPTANIPSLFPLFHRQPPVCRCRSAVSPRARPGPGFRLRNQPRSHRIQFREPTGRGFPAYDAQVRGGIDVTTAYAAPQKSDGHRCITAKM